MNPVYLRIGDGTDVRNVALQAADDPFFVRESDAEQCRLSLTPDGTLFSLKIRSIEGNGLASDQGGGNESSAETQEATQLAVPVDLFLSMPPTAQQDVEMHDAVAAGSTVSAYPRRGYSAALGGASPMDLVDPSQPRDDMEFTLLKPPSILTRQESFTREISVDQLKIIGKIGSGSCGVVFLGQWLGARVAVKKVVMSLLHGDALKEFQAETSMLKKLRHPNIVLFIGTVGKGSSPSSPFDTNELCLVTEYLARGSLLDVLGSMASVLTPRADDAAKPRLAYGMALKMALDAATGVAYLHSSNVLHRDLKSANCLVAADGTVKIADLGLARFVNQSDNHQTFCGTLTHCVRWGQTPLSPSLFLISALPARSGSRNIVWRWLLRLCR